MLIRITCPDKKLRTGGPFTQVREWVAPGAEVRRCLIRTETGDSASLRINLITVIAREGNYEGPSKSIAATA